jgi:putative transposase
MKKRKWTSEEKLQIIQEAEENGVTATLRKYGIYHTTYYQWKEKYDINGIDGLKQSYKRESQELKQLQKENLALKKLLADKELELAIKSDLLKKTLQRKQTK